MVPDVLALEGFLIEYLPSHLKSAQGLHFPLSALPDGISGDPAVWTGARSGVYLGKDMWHHGEMTSPAEGAVRPGSGGSGLRSMGEAKKFGKRAFGASLAPGGTMCQARSSVWEHEGCSWWWNRLWGVGGSCDPKGTEHPRTSGTAHAAPILSSSSPSSSISSL